MALVMALSPGALHAQRQQPPPSRPPGDGLWFSASAGRGFARVDCTICRGGRSAAMTGSLRFGGRVSRRLLVGAEGSVWLRGENQVDERIWVLGGIAQYYPSRMPRLFVKAGVAAIAYHIEDTRETLSSSGIGFQAGLGYDIPVTARYYLTPSFMLNHGVLGGRLKFNGAELTERAHTTLLQLGVGVTRK